MIPLNPSPRTPPSQPSTQPRDRKIYFQAPRGALSTLLHTTHRGLLTAPGNKSAKYIRDAHACGFHVFDGGSIDGGSTRSGTVGLCVFRFRHPTRTSQKQRRRGLDATIIISTAPHVLSGLPRFFRLSTERGRGNVCAGATEGRLLVSGLRHPISNCTTSSTSRRRDFDRRTLAKLIFLVCSLCVSYASLSRSVIP